MRPDRIILVRHGQSQGNVDKTIYENTADWSIKLTDLGHEQAEQAGRNIVQFTHQEPTQFYVSSYIRARETFKGITKAFNPENVIAREEVRLREQEWGHGRDVEMSRKIEDERMNYGEFYYRFPDGESCADVYDRISSFFDTMFRDFEKEDFPRNVVIVAHGTLLRVFLMRWFHWTIEEFENMKNPSNGSHFVLYREPNGKKYRLITPIIKYDESL